MRKSQQEPEGLAARTAHLERDHTPWLMDPSDDAGYALADRAFDSVRL